MGTHCLIAIENKDGVVQYIFCHYDGYISYMKPLLLNEYNIFKTKPSFKNINWDIFSFFQK